MQVFIAEAAIGILIAVCILFIIAPFIFGESITYDRWYVYHNAATNSYYIGYLIHYHVPCVWKSYPEGGETYYTANKREACEIANRLNTAIEEEIADAKAKEWRRVKC
jgi:hypothetical protein